MRTTRWKPSPEQYTGIAILISAGLAAVAVAVPALAFGSFVQMLGILVLSDLVLYVFLKFDTRSKPNHHD
ncbi:MAG TPA: hypothetical protein VF042_15665 [Gemmatimonadaceae bacterium]